MFHVFHPFSRKDFLIKYDRLYDHKMFSLCYCFANKGWQLFDSRSFEDAADDDDSFNACKCLRHINLSKITWNMNFLLNITYILPLLFVYAI